MTCYDVVAERDGAFWLVSVPAVKRMTQARSVREIEPMARDLIALMCNVRPDSFEVKVELRLPASVSEHLTEARRLRDLASSSNTRAAHESRAAAKELRAAGLTIRDVGEVLGVSQQRAHQLLGA